MRSALTALVLLGLLAAAGAVAFHLWRSLDGVTMSWHGVAAMALGAALALGLGVGLMRLAYLSHKRGHDEEVGGGSASSQ